MKLAKAIITALILANLVYGCAPLVIGGAVVGTTAVIHSRRDARTIADDEGIELKARKQIFDERELSKQIHINITSYNGVVLLSGEAPSEDLRARAQQIVSEIPKVRLIHNEMSIAAPSSMMTRSSDTVITGKVKTSILGINNIEGFDGSRVKVVTENGTVYLMGLLHRNEAAASVEKARSVGGVQRVVKLFEYLD